MAELKITKQNFQQEVLNSDVPVLIDFFADWCGPCKMLSPIIEEVAEKYDGKVKVCKVNVDDEPELSATFQVASIPMLVYIKDGKVVSSSVGYVPLSEVEQMIK